MNLNYPLSESSQLALRLAEQIAKEYSHPCYSADHLLWAIVQEDVGLHALFHEIDKDPVELRRWAENRFEKLPKSTRYLSSLSTDDRGTAVLRESDKLCLRYEELEISPLSILEALCSPDVGFKSEVIRRLPIALYEVIEWRNSRQNGTSTDPANLSLSQNGPRSVDTSSQSILNKYCDDLSLLAQQDKIDPIIGREKEIKQLIEMLGKRLSPNVIIVGEPGVGKTALVGGLALSILQGEVPDKLRDSRIFELDVNGRLVAGAYKGEVEERLKSVLTAIKAYGNKAILFIDEIHALLDDRGSVGSGVVNLMKPELARGELTVIGATTQVEYQKFIEKDFAFNRRFSRLVVSEPDEDLAIEMLLGLLPRYEKFHGLKVQPEAVTKSVQLAKKYVNDKQLPVSAIELIDFTMACASQMNSTSTTILNAIEEEWRSNPKPDEVKLNQKLKGRISELLISKLDMDKVTNVAGTGTLTLIEKLKSWTAVPKTHIEADDIDAILAYRTGIPIGRLRSGEEDKIRKVHEVLRQRVVGQDHVLNAVADALKTFRANLKYPHEPGSIFFFTGPTGTGKTELAKAIAELLFDDENALIRFDMSEYQESHAVAALTGAPPGYVGYEEGGLLVNKVRKNPYSVVLFDEIEKAHKDIYGLFLQMLTDSRLQDKQGKMADFSNTIIIFTSNSGADEIVKQFNAGRTPTPEELKKILRDTKHFKDEFLGRVDTQILPFAPISESVAKQILNMHVSKFVSLVKQQQNITVIVSDKVREHLLRVGFSPIFGARPLRNAIKTFLTPRLADSIIEGEIQSGDQVTVNLDDQERVKLKVKKK